MRKNNRTILILFFIAVLSHGLNGQTVTEQKTLNLSQGETYIQNVSEFVDQPISTITFPTAAQVDQKSIVNAYSLLNTDTASPPLTALATFNLGETQKYIIGITTQVTQQLTIQLTVNYQLVEIDSTANYIKQTTLSSQVIDTVSAVPYLQYGSFYSSTNGFISYSTDQDNMKSYHFSYNAQTKQILFTTLDHASLYQHVAIQGTNSGTYVIQQVGKNYQLIQFDNIQNVLSTSTISAQKCLAPEVIIDAGRALLIYCVDNSTFNILNVNYYTQKINLTQLQLAQNNEALSSFVYERIGNRLLVGLGTLTDYTVLGLVYYYNQLSDPYSLYTSQTLPFALTKPKFVSQNILVDVSNSNLNVIDFKKGQVIFQQTQVIADGMSVSSIKSISNQLIIYTTNDTTFAYNNSIVVSVNIPTFAISGVQSPVTYTLTTVSGVTYSVSITVNIVQQNTILFTQPSVLEQNLISTYYKEVQRIPIEDYVIGSDLSQLTLTIDPKYAPIVTNTQIQQTLKLDPTQDQVTLNNNCVYYQTDAIFSTLVFCPQKDSQQQQVYLAYAAKQYVIAYVTGFADFIQSEIGFLSPIATIDNQGSFILQSAPSTTYTINIPFISTDDTVLLINKLSVQCAQGTFLYASDPQYGVLFTVCNNQLTQINLQLYQGNGEAQIISSTLLTSGIATINQIICIQSTLYIYNDQNIAAYDYINFGFISSNVLVIPQVVAGKKQQLTLYKDSFLITVLDTPISIIAQYSYNNFSSTTPTLMRNLQIDSKHQIAPQGLIIPKRQNKEVAYILSTQANTYYYYRIGSRQWSNQLYTAVTFTLSSTVLSANIVFQFNPSLFTFILPQTSVTYQPSLSVDDFNSGLTWPVQFSLALPSPPTKTAFRSLSVNSNQSRLGATQQQYTLILNRNAIQQYGVVNQNAPNLQQLQQQLQVANTGDSSKVNFNDAGVFNACNLGWGFTGAVSYLDNRLISNQAVSANSTYPILYQYPVIIQTNQIIGFFNLQGDFKGCNILDDSGSFQSLPNNEYQFNVYIICKNTITQYQCNYSVDQTTKIPTGVTLTNGIKYSFTGKQVITSFKRIISMNGKFYLFLLNRMAGFSLTLNAQTLSATVTQLDNSFYGKRSFNVINQSNLQLTIQSSGLIIYQVKSAPQSSVVNIADLLAQYNFIVSEGDMINNVEQYSDTHFRIAFSQSYIYDVTIGLDNNQQLTITAANQYYYLDAFDYFISGYIVDGVTVLFGQNLLNPQYLYSALYGQNAPNNIYLIQSSSYTKLKAIDATPTYGISTKTQQSQIFTSNGQSFDLQYNPTITINLYNRQSGGQFTLFPINQQQNKKDLIQLSFPGSSSNKSSVGQLLSLSTIGTIIFGLLFLLI